MISGNAEHCPSCHTVRVTETPRRAIIYTRISRDRVGAGLGVERQAADCQALAERLGWTVVETITDNDTSAYKGVRRGYRRLLAELEAGRADAVIAWHNDRLHRSPAELEHFIVLVETRGIQVHFVQSGPVDLATPSGRMFARQLGVYARFESEHRSERVSRSRAQMAEQGRWAGGDRPFGYNADGKTLHEVESIVLRAGIEMLLEGASLRAIRRMFNDSGLRTTRKGKQWDSLAVADVLRRPRNAGLLVHQGQVKRDGAWPAVMTVEELRAVNDILDQAARRTSPGNQPRWLGSMIYRCGRDGCADTLVVGTSGGVGRQPSYRCQSSVRSGAARHVTRAARTLDAFVAESILNRLGEPEFAELYSRPVAPPVNVAAVRAELAEIERSRRELASRQGAGRITWDQFDAANDALAVRQSAAESALAATERSDPLAHLASAPDVRLCWKGYELGQRREVLRRIVTVTVLPAGRGRQPDGSYFDESRIVMDWN